MPIIKGKKLLYHALPRVFECAMDIERYPEFLPYIKSVNVLESDEKRIKAKIKIGIMRFSFAYLCEIQFINNEYIRVTSDSRLFRHFTAECIFIELDDERTKINYIFTCTFSSSAMELFAKALLPINTKITIAIFENRLQRALNRAF